MLYQKMLLDQQPYHVCITKRMKSFEKHRHPEIELNYCIEGEFAVIINNEERVLRQGDLVIIDSMEAHEYPEKNRTDCRMLVIEVGPILLSRYFDLLVNIATTNPVLKVDEKNNKELYAIFLEVIELQESMADFAGLTIKGNLYKICAYLLRKLGTITSTEQSPEQKHLVTSIEKALELIEHNYRESLSVEEVAKICGYTKSNFCKIFKRITGDTFHSLLNRYRVKMACILLDKTNYSVETIAAEVGFADAKVLCRVFKAEKGITTGKYRKEKQKKRQETKAL